MFRPFMPGRYDHLAVTISFMAQIFSFASIILVPLGLLWILGRRDKGDIGNRNKRFKTVSLIFLVLVAISVSIAPFSQNNLSFAVIFLGISFSSIVGTYIKNKKSTSLTNPIYDKTPLYLILIPLIVVVVRFTYIDKAVNFSRELAVRNSEELIHKIENYFDKNGQYPISLQALSSDIMPQVIGIHQYFYEPNGNAYNLYFKQFSDELDVHEIVMYNKFEEHFFAAHALDILEFTGEELALRRGDRRRFKLMAPHWICIKFE